MAGVGGAVADPATQVAPVGVLDAAIDGGACVGIGRVVRRTRTVRLRPLVHIQRMALGVVDEGAVERGVGIVDVAVLDLGGVADKAIAIACWLFVE